MTIKNKFIALILIMFCSLSSMAQVGVGTNIPNANAALDIASTSQGMLFPRMTTAQRDAIVSPAKGLTIFNTTLDCIQTNIGTTTVPVWKCLAATNNTTKGTAVISAYNCNFASAGTLYVGSAIAEGTVTQTIQATVTTGGTYNISTNTANGVTFSGSGSFAGTGTQNIVLTASGTPTAKGSSTFTLITAPTCSFDRYASVTGYYANVGGTIKDFAKSNLGTDTSLVEPYVVGNADGSGGTLGYLYQWGRQTDGHELRNSAQMSGSQNAAIAGKFIIPTSDDVKDWISPQNNLLWGDGTTTTISPAKAVNDPCPVGFKIPSQNQWNRLYRDGITSGVAADATYNTWTWTGYGYKLKPSNTNGDYNLYLPAAGYRDHVDGGVKNAGTIGYYWSSDISSTTPTSGAYMFFLYNNHTDKEVYPNGQARRGNGFSIRCIAVDSPSTNGEAVVSGYVSKSSTGTMKVGVAVLDVTQTITASVTTVGTYGIATTANGVTFGKTGTFTSEGAQDIVLTATGTPTNLGDNTFTLNTTPNFSFSRTTYVNPSTNGTAKVSFYTCNTASSGIMTAGTSTTAPGRVVTQTITATVTIIGTYSISTPISNGVIFEGTGTFTTLGDQDIVLTAIGTPTTLGDNTFTLDTTPNCSFTRTTSQSSSNGNAIVSGYICTTASQGTMTAGVAVSSVTQTITATVTTIGTYSISTPIINGVTFGKTGTFTTLGAQDIVLTATGTPTAAGDNSFTLNTTPNCSFSRTTFSPTSNGTAIVSGYTSATTFSGILKKDRTITITDNIVTQNITATVTTAGTYKISTTTPNGVMFSAIGTFGGTGDQPIVLYATGIPAEKGSHTFTLNTTPNCSFSRYTSVTGVYANVGGTIKDFLAYNLGVTGSQDPMTYQSGSNNGALYQWGRNTDGHQSRTSATVAYGASDAAGKFITTSAAPNDWNSTPNNLLWGDGLTTEQAKKADDPCPSGYKIPSQSQLAGLYTNTIINPPPLTAPGDATMNTWKWSDSNNGYELRPIGTTSSTTLFLPAAGYRPYDGSTIANVGGNGFYWSSRGGVVSGASNYLYFSNSTVNPSNATIVRAAGLSVRCIEE